MCGHVHKCVWLCKVSSEPMHYKRYGVKSTQSMGEKEVGWQPLVSIYLTLDSCFKKLDFMPHMSFICYRKENKMV